MNITFLGHAGFLVETDGAIVVADAWLSPEGAFDSAWMQLPRNHHLRPAVRERLERTGKPIFLYVSHEHRDHFDPTFLRTLPTGRITAVIPRFRRQAVHAEMEPLGWKELVVLGDGEELPIPGGSIKLFVEDSVLNRDSALLVRADGQTFLDINDCKVHDRMASIAAREGPIDVFAAQFSGAIWHPPSYEYEGKAYETQSRRKMFSKFEAVARSLEALRPRAYLASAGPCAFLDPELRHVNFEPVNIFPRASRFFGFLQKRLGNVATRLHEPMPGDVLDVASCDFTAQGGERVNDETFATYVEAYAAEMAPVFRARERAFGPGEVEAVFGRLRDELAAKLAALSLRDRVELPFHAALRELPGRWLRIDFPAGRIDEVPEVPADRRYTFVASARDIERVLDRKLTWEEFMLSLRVRLSRKPDRYDPILHGFLTLEAGDLADFCAAILANDARQERFLVQAGEKVYSVHRYCPHQGADLTQAWVEDGRYLVCPRHRWQFDLEDEGKCAANCASVRARPATEAEVAEVVARRAEADRAAAAKAAETPATDGAPAVPEVDAG